MGLLFSSLLFSSLLFSSLLFSSLLFFLFFFFFFFFFFPSGFFFFFFFCRSALFFIFCTSSGTSYSLIILNKYSLFYKWPLERPQVRIILVRLLLGGGLLGGLLSSGLLSLSWGLLGGLSGLLGLSGSLLGWLLSLSGGFLGSGLLGLLSSRLLLCLDGLGGLWLLGQLEGTGSLLASGSSSHDSLGGHELLQGEPDTSGSLGSVNLVVGTDVLQDGLAGGALLVSESLDGGLDHGGVGGVGSGGLGLGDLLGFGCSGGSHGDVVT